MTNQVNQAFEEWYKESFPMDDNSDMNDNYIAKQAYQAATQASEIEINSLKERVAELQSDNNKLREALERLDGWLEVRHLGGLMPNEKELLKTTTAQSLAEHGNEVIERRG